MMWTLMLALRQESVFRLISALATRIYSYVEGVTICR